MPVTDVKTFVVGNPPPRKGGRYFIFVRLETDQKIVGYGECYAATFSPHIIASMIEDVAARYVIGADPFQIETLWRRIYGSGYHSRPDITLVAVLSALEMALWDIVGKETGKPAHQLLGGKVHEKLRTYTYLYPPEDGDAHGNDGVYSDPVQAAQRALDYVSMGFTGIKFDPAGDYTVFDGRQPDLEALERSANFLKEIRQAVGTKADLLFGTHGQFTASGAIRMARYLEPFDPLWFEEPMPPDNPQEMARVARQTSIPVATGERLSTKAEFAQVLRHEAASILQMNLGRVGGLLEAKKIAGMAEAFHALIAPHLYCGPLVAAANIQLAACSPNFLILESIETMQGFHSTLLKKPFLWQDGYLIVSDAPGLGAELDEDVALAHPYSGQDLHLGMQPDPHPLTS